MKTEMIFYLVWLIGCIINLVVLWLYNRAEKKKMKKPALKEGYGWNILIVALGSWFLWLFFGFAYVIERFKNE